MTHLMDTNVAIHLRDRDRVLTDRLYALASLPCVSMLSVVELEGGIYRDRALSGYRRRLVSAMLAQLTILSLSREVVTAYGNIVSVHGFSRARIIDRLIATTAIVHDLTLITINERDFAGIPALKLEVWPAQ